MGDGSRSRLYWRQAGSVAVDYLGAVVGNMLHDGGQQVGGGGDLDTAIDPGTGDAPAPRGGPCGVQDRILRAA